MRTRLNEKETERMVRAWCKEQFPEWTLETCSVIDEGIEIELERVQDAEQSAKVPFPAEANRDPF